MGREHYAHSARLADYCWTSTVWNLEFDETVPFVMRPVIGFFEPTNIEEVSSRTPPTSHILTSKGRMSRVRGGSPRNLLDPGTLWFSEVNEAQKCPWGEVPLVFFRGDPWGTPLQLERNYSRSHVKPPRGQILRSPRPKVVTSVLTRPQCQRAVETQPPRSSSRGD